MKKTNIDVLFVHPPANLSNSIPTLDADVAYTNQFVSFPAGFFSMGNNLDNAGYTARILNLGERVFRNKRETLNALVKSFIRQYSPRITCIDAHWMIHSAGAVETARLFKKYFPQTRTVLGGFTASLFSEEILEKYPDVEFIMRGQCDESVVDLAEELLKNGFDLKRIPGLVYKTPTGIVKNKPATPDVRKSLDLTRYDLLLDKPLVNPDRALITMFRGCNRTCNYCTGGLKSFKEAMGASETYIIDPETVVELIKKNMQKGRDKIYLYGDIRRDGEKYIGRFFKALERSGISGVHIVFEFFSLADKRYLERWTTWSKTHDSTLEATHSPESGNRKLRRQYFKGYTNDELLEHCRLVADYGIPQSTYFMLGIPGDTKETVEETLQLADKIVAIYASRFRKENLRHDVLPYTFMQMPDAGSLLFRTPEKYGYRFDFEGFEGLVHKLTAARHWSDAVGYRTKHFSKTELIETYYMIQKRMKQTYLKHDLIVASEYETEIAALDKDFALWKSLDELLFATPNP
ncbi:radical SAM protein [Candidatus Woesearchaeota archaeon]|nr:radical SAM protein [Candidatus Woesearchaeota archaeon]